MSLHDPPNVTFNWNRLGWELMLVGRCISFKSEESVMRLPTQLEQQQELDRWYDQSMADRNFERSYLGDEVQYRIHRVADRDDTLTALGNSALLYGDVRRS